MSGTRKIENAVKIYNEAIYSTIYFKANLLSHLIIAKTDTLLNTHTHTYT